MTKISIIGTNGIPAKYGGFETLAYYLAKTFKDKYSVTVYCSSENRPITKFYKNIRLKYIPLKANGSQSIFYDFFSIIHAYINSQNLIILGFSGFLAFPLNIFFRKNIIFNVGGIEWKKVRGSKKFSKLEVFCKKIMENVCVKFSNHVVIDNKSFDSYFRNYYSIVPNLIEYGGDHVYNSNTIYNLADSYEFLNYEYDLIVSRAQEDMNIHLVIDAYKKQNKRKLVVISNWNSSNYGKELYSLNYKKYDSIFLVDAIYNIKDLNTIRKKASLYIHPHELCGTAPSLVEAMTLALPIIAYDVEANISTTENKAIYFKTPANLFDIISNISKVELDNIKKSMKEIADRRYTWSRVSDLYERLLIK